MLSSTVVSNTLKFSDLSLQNLQLGLERCGLDHHLLWLTFCLFLLLRIRSGKWEDLKIRDCGAPSTEMILRVKRNHSESLRNLNVGRNLNPPSNLYHGCSREHSLILFSHGCVGWHSIQIRFLLILPNVLSVHLWSTHRCSRRRHSHSASRGKLFIVIRYVSIELRCFSCGNERWHCDRITIKVINGY